MFRSSHLLVVNFRSGGKSDIKKKGERRRMLFKEYLFLFLFFSFLLYLLWSGSGTSREVVSALNSRADVTSLLVIVFTCCASLGLLLSSLSRFTENLSIYLSPPAPNSSLQNPSNFGATASHWLLYFLLFFFFSDFWPDGCVEPYTWRRVYTFCMWQPTSQHPVGSFIVNS